MTKEDRWDRGVRLGLEASLIAKFPWEKYNQTTPAEATEILRVVMDEVPGLDAEMYLRLALGVALTVNTRPSADPFAGL